MNNKEFPNGWIWVGAPDGSMEGIKGLTTVDLLAASEVRYPYTPMCIRAFEKASLSAKMSLKGLEDFLQTMCGIREQAFDLCEAAGYGRIVHLAKHARKARVRKKNLYRVMRICEKIAGKELR